LIVITPPNNNTYNDATIHQDNWLGRDEEDDKVEEVKPNEQVRDLNLASLAINPLPDFAFYAKEKVEIQQLNFADTFERHPIEPTTFQDAYNHLDPSQCKKNLLFKCYHSMTDSYKEDPH